MNRTPGRLTRPQLALIGALMLLSTSCRTQQNQWSFAVSRAAYSGSGGDYIGGDLAHCGSGSEGAALVLLAFLLLPLAIDLVALPVTLTHDYCN